MLKQKIGTFRVLTLIALFGFVGLLTPSNVFSKPVFKEGYCNSCEPPGPGTYAFHYIEGKPFTTFYPDDDGNPTIKEGHGTFLVDPNGKDSIDYKDLVQTTFRMLSKDAIALESDKPVEVTIVDVSISDFVSDFIEVSSYKEIDISHLAIGCKYNLIVWYEVEPGVILPVKSYLFCRE